MIQSFRDPWVKKAKWLTQALIISGTLNVGLLCTFIYLALKEDKPLVPLDLTASPIPKSSKEKMSMPELIESYSTLSFQELLFRLSNTNHVESGYTQRDVALGCLVTFHHFNLERALGGVALQKRSITFSEGNTLTIFPGLADYQYQAIVSYAKTEKWPLTSEGLFIELKKQKPPYDPSLIDTFSLSAEFHFISMLFSKTGIHLRKEHIVALIVQSDWPTLQKTSHHLHIHSAFTIEQRRQFLHRLILQHSMIAAKILLETDQEYCLKYLEDSQVIAICDLLKDRTTPSFLRELLKSPRSDDIWKKAASILYEQAAEEVPNNLVLEAAKRRFLELKTTTPSPSAPSVPKQDHTYTVVGGDSLWKIAHEHHTTVKALREVNHLSSDILRVGQQLILP